MLAEVRQVVLQDLLEQLHDLLHLAVVEAVKGHDGELGHHVAEGGEGLVFGHVHQEHRRNVGHALHVPIVMLAIVRLPDVWPVHSEGFEYSLQFLVPLASRQKDFEGREGTRNVCLDDANALLSAERRLSLKQFRACNVLNSLLKLGIALVQLDELD